MSGRSISQVAETYNSSLTVLDIPLPSLSPLSLSSPSPIPPSHPSILTLFFSRISSFFLLFFDYVFWFVADIQRCELLEEKSAYALATHCPNLRKIDLYVLPFPLPFPVRLPPFCTLSPCLSFLLLTTACRSWMFSLTDNGLANLLERATQLKKVRLEGCKYVS